MNEKKKIKIAFKGMWKGFENDVDDYLPYIFLKEKYDTEIVDKDAEFVFCNVYDHEAFLREKGVRIMTATEQYTPCWSAIDYALGDEYMTYGERYFRIPAVYWMKTSFLNEDAVQKAAYKHIDVSEDILRRKSKFCNFLHGNSEFVTTGRGEFFEALSKYKTVEAAGDAYRNVDFRVPRGKKLEYQKDFKFTIAFENHCFPGYTTEKIFEALASQTIPIYYGDPFVTNDLNERAFINGNGKTFEEIIETVKEVDNDDKKFTDMLKEPAFQDKNCVDVYLEGMKKFLYDIVEKGPVYARSRYIWTRKEERAMRIGYTVKKVSRRVLTRPVYLFLRKKIVSKE